ncbi:GGDEF/EAL domain-containing response regulator [Microseira wollei]|uniref:Response regulator receiver modulated diguanylate cyclase/phosphodiesterase n=1 Tax=Microseira wollei NIES-4236 TaxID=2530354 RepID=A0AAV3X407_9CYAN|nr:EAL domain-containing response regulator [Microseira wollei]GET36998.1 response regulator receiver modulated diguanylate cyclase/phosphodiesterase [Microseira wollei NIES-4236]
MKPAKILVVDDETDLERLIKQRFRKKIIAKQLDFIFVKNGVEAIKKLETKDAVDMVLTDINMPEMDGLTLLTRLPEIDQTIKAVVLSAYGDIPTIRVAMNRGAFDFITKPIDFQDLEITIDKTINFVKQIREQKEKLKQALEQLRYEAFYDPLTGLPNQNYILGRIRQCIQCREQRNSLFAVLCLSLDGFKAVKYGLGHALSDRLLVEVARRLETYTHPTDMVARCGTDEFAILLTDLPNFKQAENKAEQLRQVLRTQFKLNGSVVSSNIYIGIVNSTIDYNQPEDFLRAADTAMNYAKMPGRPNIVVFDTGMQASILERLELEADLQRAIEQQQFHLNYQPIVSLSTGKIVGFEALVRWQHPGRGWVSPEKFIPLAEETGLIIPLGKWVLSEACRQLSVWQEQFSQRLPLSISVNLSGIQLWNPDVLQSIDEILNSLSLSGSYLKLEITESILMDKESEATAVLDQLKQRQIQLSIDDFGTGYSSLAYLQSFPIDTLKIDRSFISGIEQQETNLDITRTIITLAHTLELDVIAEGVETQEQLEILRALGCEYGQGYLFSPPLEGAAVVNFMAELEL